MPPSPVPSSDAPSASSASSSDDDDAEHAARLAALASCAVSFEDLQKQQQKAAEQGKRRVEGKRDRDRDRGREQQQQQQGDDNAAAGGGDGGGDGDGGAEPAQDWRQDLPVLDLTQIKIAGMLDGILERQLASWKFKKPKQDKEQRREEKRRRRAAEAEAEAGGEGPSSSAGGGSALAEPASDAGGFRFFRRVPRGTPVVLERPPEPPIKGDPFPDQFQKRRRPDRQAHAASLAPLAAEGERVAAAARAAMDTAAAAAKGQGQKRLPCSGTVVEAGRPAVPQDVRVQRLLGVAAGAAGHGA